MEGKQRAQELNTKNLLSNTNSALLSNTDRVCVGKMVKESACVWVSQCIYLYVHVYVCLCVCVCVCVVCVCTRRSLFFAVDGDNTKCADEKVFKKGIVVHHQCYIAHVW